MTTPCANETLVVGSMVGLLRLDKDVSQQTGDGKYRRMWSCFCTACKKRTTVRHDTLTSRSPPKSCGCKMRESQVATRRAENDITGVTVSQWLTAIELVGHTPSKNSLWRCHCSGCGKDVVLQRTVLVRDPPQQSCGCQQAALVGEANTTHGATRGAGQGAARETWYTTYSAMVERCTNPNHHAYASYGGRGIQVFAGWLGEGGPVAFRDYLRSALGERPEGDTMDRIDNDRGYEPGNLRWADRLTQQNNTRATHHFTAFGVELNVRRWAALLGMGDSGLGKRLARREQALEAAGPDAAAQARVPSVELLLATPSAKATLVVPHPLTPSGLYDVPALLRAAGLSPDAAAPTTEALATAARGTTRLPPKHIGPPVAAQPVATEQTASTTPNRGEVPPGHAKRKRVAVPWTQAGVEAARAAPTQPPIAARAATTQPIAARAAPTQPIATEGAASATHNMDCATSAEGVTMPLKHWAEQSGVPVNTLRTRLAGGAGLTKRPLTLEQAMGKGAGVKRMLTHTNGDSRSLSDWAAFAGLSPGCLNRRLARGAALEAALGSPPTTDSVSA